MIRPSPELEAIARRWMDLLMQSDGAGAVNLFSRSDHLTYCGSGPGEVWSGSFLHDTYAQHVAEIPRSGARNVQVRAFENGTTGWAFWEGDITWFAPGRTARFRTTLVFTMDDAIWRVVHVHHSNPVSNQDTFGYAHSALDALLAAAETSQPTFGKSGSATVMFTDIADSSALAEAVGDERWTGIVQRHVAMVSDSVISQDGTLVKSLGDGTMSTFASAAAAMRAAQNIQQSQAAQGGEPHLRLRIGLHTGDVVAAGQDFFGTVVNKAARIADATAPGEIRISDATRAMVGNGRGFAFSDSVRLLLRGLEGEHLLHRLEWQS